MIEETPVPPLLGGSGRDGQANRTAETEGRYIMPRKMRSTWGSNQPARRKGYRYLRFTADIGDGRGWTRHRLTFRGTKREGDEELRRLWKRYVDDANPSTKRKAQRMTVTQAYERLWLPDADDRVVKGTLKQQSIRQYRSVWNKHILPRWGDALIDEIRPADMQDWLLSLGKSASSNSAMLLRQAVQLARIYGGVMADPMSPDYRTSKEQNDQDGYVWTLPELRAIWSEVRGRWPLCVTFSLIAFGSCRIGESLGPKPEDVREVTANGMTIAAVHIVRQINNQGKVDDSLKNGWSPRWVVVPEPMSAYVLEAAASGYGWLTDNGVGGYVSQKTLTSHWKAFLDEAGMEQHPMKNLRKSWRTFMAWDADIEDWKLEKMMGHTVKGTTPKYYDKPTVEMFADTLSDAFQKHGITDGWDK